MELNIQTTHPPNFLQTVPSAPPLHHAMSETPNANHHSIDEASSSTTPPPPPPSSGKASTSGLNSHESVIVHEPSPSAPPLTDDDDVQTPEEGPFHYPTIDSTPVDVPSSYPLPASAEGEKKEDGALDSVLYVSTLHLTRFAFRVDMSQDACLA